MASAPQSPPDFSVPVTRRGMGIVIGFLLFLAIVGTLALYEAAIPGGDLVPRILLFFIAAIGLALPSWFAFVVVRRKIRTDHYLLTFEERRALYIKSASRESSPRYRKLFTGFWALLAAFWIGYAAFAIHAAILHPAKRFSAAIFLVLGISQTALAINMTRKSTMFPSPPDSAS